MLDRPKKRTGKNMTDNLVFLTRCVDVNESMIIRSVLEDHGIYVYLQGENHRSLMGLVGSFIELRVLVPEESLEQARRILKGLESEEIQEGELGEVRFPEEMPSEEVSPDADLDRGTPVFNTGWLLVPFLGFGLLHLCAGAWLRGAVLALIDLYAFYTWELSEPSFLLTHFFVIVADAIGGLLAMAEKKDGAAKD